MHSADKGSSAFPTVSIFWPRHYIWNGTLKIPGPYGCRTVLASEQTMHITSNPQPTGVYDLINKEYNADFARDDPKGLYYNWINGEQSMEHWLYEVFSDRFPDQPAFTYCKWYDGPGPHWAAPMATRWTTVSSVTYH